MISLFLVFLAIWPTHEADPKCPEGFTLFTRVPTAKNQFTKDWCLAVFEQPHDKTENNMTTTYKPVDYENRENARSKCAYHNSTMSLPENLKEFEFVTEKISIENHTAVAMDGEITPVCKGRYYRGLEKDFKESVGSCNIKKDLLIFESPNTDPSFVQSSFHYFIPSTYSSSQENKEAVLYNIASCMSAVKDLFNSTATAYVQMSFCSGRAENLSKNVDMVLCGRRP